MHDGLALPAGLDIGLGRVDLLTVGHGRVEVVIEIKRTTFRTRKLEAVQTQGCFPVGLGENG
jgi:hypothetical protein